MIQLYYQKRENRWYGAAVQNKQVIAANFSLEKPELRQLVRKIPNVTTFQVVEKPDKVLEDVISALEAAFNGKDAESYGFKIEMTRLSSYTQKVLNCTRLVPIGYITTYGAVAKVTGGIGRSVGRVEASNPFPLLIPCHRVVCSDLSIGGYGYGEQTKMEILQNEERDYKETKILKVYDKELALFPVEWVTQKHG